ncbi:hypothetical protein AKO1_015453 [Acrasis kona]|uniref:Endosomal/lysosomal proton channel TMEM175 n=1 Tax=Acrasis kona TaxID=1008807 RepID=A0AAW2YKR5_9EUKA
MTMITMRLSIAPILYSFGMIIAPIHPITSIATTFVGPFLLIFNSLFNIDAFGIVFRILRYFGTTVLRRDPKRKNIYYGVFDIQSDDILYQAQSNVINKSLKINIQEEADHVPHTEVFDQDLITIKDSKTTFLTTEGEETIIFEDFISIPYHALKDEKKVVGYGGTISPSDHEVEVSITTIKRPGSIKIDIETGAKESFIASERFHELMMERIKGFSDAVFAIVITILVIKLHPPSHELFVSDSDQLLVEKIKKEVPLLIAFFLSVLITGSLWRLHAFVLKPVIKTTRLYLNANVLFLSLVSLIPFASDLLGKYRGFILSSVFFNILFALCGISLLFIYHIQVFHRGGLTTPLSSKQIFIGFVRLIFGPVVCAVAVGVAFHNVTVSVAMPLSILIIEILASLKLNLYYLIYKIFQKIDGCAQNLKHMAINQGHY